MLVEKIQLWAKARNNGDLSQEALVATRTLINSADQDMPVLKKGYVNLLCCFATEVQTARCESQAQSREEKDQTPKVGSQNVRRSFRLIMLKKQLIYINKCLSG